MIADLKPYADYRESGLPWLGQVPGHWEVRQARRVGRLLKGVGGTKEDAVTEGMPCIRYGELYTTYGYFIRASRTFIKPQRVGAYTPIQYGDVLFAASGETIEDIGKSAVNLMQTSAVCGGDVIVLRPTISVHAPFLGYAMDCRPATNQKATMARGTTVKHVYPDELRTLLVPLPPPDEQAAIVRFLDWANGRLERASRAKRKVIALLGEQKQAIIHRAVTRGLDPSVPLKPSGIPWLGDIPEHWEVQRMKRVCRVQGGYAFPSSAFSDTGIPVVRMNNLRRGVLDLSGAARIREADCVEVFGLRNGDILYGLSGSIGSTGSLGNYAVVAEGDLPAMLNQRVARLVPKCHKVEPNFLIQIIQSSVFYEQVLAGTTGTAQFNVSTNDIENMAVAISPLDEQERIVSHIEESVAPLAIAISRLGREIELLREVRTRLVADVVTGKLDVREAAAQLPDEAAPDTLEDDTDPGFDPDPADEEAAV